MRGGLVMGADKVADREGAIDVCLVDRVVEEETGRGPEERTSATPGPRRCWFEATRGTVRARACARRRSERAPSSLQRPPTSRAKDDQTTAGGAGRRTPGRLQRRPQGLVGPPRLAGCSTRGKTSVASMAGAMDEGEAVGDDFDPAVIPVRYRVQG